MLSVVILLIATGQQHIPKRERMFDWSLKICGQHIRRGCVTKTFVFTLTVFSNIDCVKTFCVYSQSVFLFLIILSNIVILSSTSVASFKTLAVLIMHRPSAYFS